MQLFDAHAHLAAPDFADDLSDVLARAASVGVRGVVTVGETLADAERILDLAVRHPLIKPAAGLFPTILDPAAAEGAEAGYAFSIPPSVVRSPRKQKLVQRLPLECLLLETGSPVLESDPAVRNEPANVTTACRVVAELKGVTPETVARVTTDNARRLFPRAFA